MQPARKPLVEDQIAGLFSFQCFTFSIFYYNAKMKNMTITITKDFKVIFAIMQAQLLSAGIY